VVSYDEFRDVCKCTDYVNVLIRSRCYEDTPSPADGYQIHNSGTYYSSDPVGYYDDNGHPVIPNRAYAEYNGHYDYSDDGVSYQRSGSSRYNQHFQRSNGRGQHGGHVQGERSDSESEPMSYNSRPQSYITGRSAVNYWNLFVGLQFCCNGVYSFVQII
jgi:hypothetical protein